MNVRSRIWHTEKAAQTVAVLRRSFWDNVRREHHRHSVFCWCQRALGVVASDPSLPAKVWDGSGLGRSDEAAGLCHHRRLYCRDTDFSGIS